MSYRPKFLALLQESTIPLLADGAIGTMLNARGLWFDQCYDGLNLTQPALVADIHRAYIDAGAQVITTNTFGANRYKLAAHGMDGKVAEINRAGVELARRVVNASFKEVLIAGDVGPLGVRLAPFGRVQHDQARVVFTEQIVALAEAGADLLIIETFSDLYEIREAVSAAREVSDLPVVATMTFTRDDRTLLGDSPTKVARMLYESGADVIGVNCSGGPAQIWRILRRMREAVPDAVFACQPNAGWPEQVGGRIMYPANPDYFGEYALALCDAGANLVGGCCGTTPQHIQTMRTALDSAPDGCGPSLEELRMPIQRSVELPLPEQPSQLAHKLAEGQFVVAVEMDPPRGLSPHKLHAGASLLAEAGLILIGGGPPPAVVKPRWAASIDPDWLTPVREAWPEVISGNGGFSADVTLVISDQNQELFSPGRQRLVESTLAELLAGYIDTGIDPITGE